MPAHASGGGQEQGTSRRDQYATSDPVQPPNAYSSGRRVRCESPPQRTPFGRRRFTRRCQELIGALVDDATVLLTTSGTHALDLIALLLEIGPGDEVIVPSFTFSSTVNAFVLRGATPVFIDIRRDTLNLDERRLEDLITGRTRAIVPVHYAGVACEMDPILDIAARHGVTVVEDNAHGLFGRYRGQPLGTFGPMAAQSFHETKNFTCGEGGAIVINDPAVRRTSRDHPREGHQPPELLPWPR